MTHSTQLCSILAHYCFAEKSCSSVDDCSLTNDALTLSTPPETWPDSAASKFRFLSSSLLSLYHFFEYILSSTYSPTLPWPLPHPSRVGPVTDEPPLQDSCRHTIHTIRNPTTASLVRNKLEGLFVVVELICDKKGDCEMFARGSAGNLNPIRSDEATQNKMENSTKRHISLLVHTNFLLP